MSDVTGLYYCYIDKSTADGILNILNGGNSSEFKHGVNEFITEYLRISLDNIIYDTKEEYKIYDSKHVDETMIYNHYKMGSAKSDFIDLSSIYDADQNKIYIHITEPDDADHVLLVAEYDFDNADKYKEYIKDKDIVPNIFYKFFMENVCQKILNLLANQFYIEKAEVENEPMFIHYCIVVDGKPYYSFNSILHYPILITENAKREVSINLSDIEVEGFNDNNDYLTSENTILKNIIHKYSVVSTLYLNHPYPIRCLNSVFEEIKE